MLACLLYEVCDHEGRHRAWWIKNNMKVQRLEVWIAVDFNASTGSERTLCPTDLVVEQGAYALDGQVQTPGGRSPVHAQLRRAVGDAVIDEFVRMHRVVN